MISSIESGLEFFQGCYWQLVRQSSSFIIMFIVPLVQCATQVQIITAVKNVLVLVVAGALMHGPNCVEGTHQGPVNKYSCPEGYWRFETCRDTE